MSHTLGKVCTACGRERSKTKTIMYHPVTLQPYCEHPYICNQDHPNSPPNLIKRGSELQLITQSDAQKLFKEQLIKEVGDPDKIAKIRNMVEKPMTIRIGSPDLAQFLVRLQDKFGLTTMSDAIRYCIELAMDNEGNYRQDVEKFEEKLEEDRQEKQLVEELENMPVKKYEPEPVENVPETEDEFVF